MLKIKYHKEVPKDKKGNPIKPEDSIKHVFRIIAGNKFYIGRTSNFKFFDEEIRKTHRRYLYGNGIPEKNQYYDLVKYMVSIDTEVLTTEPIFSSENGYLVLKEELNQLELNFGKRNCANMNNIPNVPKFKTGETSNKWLTHNEYLNFMKLLKKYDY